jgi:hypothetical protein
MKPLAIISNCILAICIVLSGVTFVVDKVSQASYLTQTAEKSNIYSGISEIARDRVAETAAQSLGVPEESIRQTVAGLVSEEYIQTKSAEINDQVEQVLRGESNKISVQFTDLLAQANAAGLGLNSTDLKPIEIELPPSTSQTTVQSAQNLDLIRFVSYTITALFLVISLALSVLRRSTLGLGLAFGFSGIAFTVLALASKLLEAALVNLVALPETVKELDAYADAFVEAIVSDVSRQYFIFAAVLGLLFAMCIISHRLLRPLRIKKNSIQQSANTIASPAVPR